MSENDDLEQKVVDAAVAAGLSEDEETLLRTMAAEARQDLDEGDIMEADWVKTLRESLEESFKTGVLAEPEVASSEIVGVDPDMTGDETSTEYVARRRS